MVEEETMLLRKYVRALESSDAIDPKYEKTVEELEDEVKALRINLEKNTNEMQSLIDKQVEMLSKDSISLEVISRELDILSERVPGMAYEVFEKMSRTKFETKMAEEEREEKYAGWKRAVAQVLTK